MIFASLGEVFVTEKLAYALYILLALLVLWLACEVQVCHGCHDLVTVWHG